MKRDAGVAAGVFFLVLSFIILLLSFLPLGLAIWTTNVGSWILRSNVTNHDDCRLESLGGSIQILGYLLFVVFGIVCVVCICQTLAAVCHCTSALSSKLSRLYIPATVCNAGGLCFVLFLIPVGIAWFAYWILVNVDGWGGCDRSGVAEAYWPNVKGYLITSYVLMGVCPCTLLCGLGCLYCGISVSAICGYRFEKFFQAG